MPAAGAPPGAASEQRVDDAQADADVRQQRSHPPVGPVNASEHGDDRHQAQRQGNRQQRSDQQARARGHAARAAQFPKRLPGLAQGRCLHVSKCTSGGGADQAGCGRKHRNESCFRCQLQSHRGRRRPGARCARHRLDGAHPLRLLTAGYAAPSRVRRRDLEWAPALGRQDLAFGLFFQCRLERMRAERPTLQHRRVDGVQFVHRQALLR